MKLYSAGIVVGPRRRSILAAPALVLGLALLACSPGEGAPEEDAVDLGTAEQPVPTARDGSRANGGAAQEAPACRFTASGDELRGRASPPDSATVRLNGETTKLCYSAPSVRDREIMGGLVPYGEPWRMGANEPTTLHLPVAAEVGGVRVEPGSYALYTIPGESEWTIVLNSEPERWGIPIDEEVAASDVGRFTVRPERLDEPVERMSIEMESTEEGAARAVLEWENTRVSFPIRRAEE